MARPKKKSGEAKVFPRINPPADPPKYVTEQAYHRTPSSHAIHSQRRGFTGKQQAMHEAQLEDIANDPHARADLALTYQIAEKLEQHYPAHPWRVAVSHAQGVAMIKLPILMRADQQYVLHIEALKTDPGLKLVVRAGGDLLERHKMPRAGFSLTPFLEARDAVHNRRKRLLTPDPSKVISKLRQDGAPAIVMPEFETSRRAGA